MISESMDEDSPLDRPMEALAQCVAASDWLTNVWHLTPSKLHKIWSVLKIENELDLIYMAKTKQMLLKEKKEAEKSSSAPPTPVKTPKTRNQKKEHTKVS